MSLLNIKVPLIHEQAETMLEQQQDIIDRHRFDVSNSIDYLPLKLTSLLQNPYQTTKQQGRHIRIQLNE